MNSHDAKFLGYFALTVATSTLRMKKTSKKYAVKAGLI